MTRDEAYNKLMGFKAIFPSASKEIDDMYKALTYNKSVIDAIKNVQSVLRKYPSDGTNKAYCALNKVLVETGDYNGHILDLLYSYGMYDSENGCDFIKFDKPIEDNKFSIDKVYVKDNNNVVWVGLTDNNDVDLTFSSLTFDMRINVYKELKKAISKSVIENKVVEDIVSFNRYYGSEYELCLEKCITLMYDKEEVDIVRLVVEDCSRVVCHALNRNDETIFIPFDSLPFEVQEDIYNIYNN